MRENRSDQMLGRLAFVGVMVISAAIVTPWITDDPKVIFWSRAGGAILLATTVLGVAIENWNERRP